MKALPVWPLALLYGALINLVTWHAWRVDKRNAVTREKRIPERTLLALCWLGGWPAALISAHVFRHKGSKKAFIHKVYRVAGFECAALCLILLLLWRPV